MNGNIEKFVSHEFLSQNIQTLNITCKNYIVHIMEGDGEKISISYYNNRFRTMELRSGKRGIYLEDKMTVTFYELLRLVELMDNNELEIKIPENCSELNISVETGVTGITVDDIAANNLRLISASGHINIRNICVGKALYAHSTSGMVSCILPDTEADYDIDCRAERMDVPQPYYPANHEASRKIVLRSNMYVPDLMFAGKTNCQAGAGDINCL